MHITVSSSFPGALHPEIDALVRAGFAGVETGDVEVHVKARSEVLRAYIAEWPSGSLDDDVERYRFRRKKDAVAAALRHGGRAFVATRRHPRAGGWSARTFNGIPGLARVEPGMRYLVTMNIPRDPRKLTRYPERHRDPRLKTSPVVEFTCWQDQLLHLAAHEARHVHQFRHGLPGSELDAERWAAAVASEHARGAPAGAVTRRR